MKTPTLDKIAEVRETSQAIGEFLEWLRTERKLLLAEDVPASWTCEICGPVPKKEVGFVDWFSNDTAQWRHKAKHCGGKVDHIPEGLYPAGVTIQALLAEYFEIDEEAAEGERRALLDELRRKGA